MAVNPLQIAKCQVVEVDVPLTLFTLLTLWLAVRWMDSGKIEHAVLTGVALGLAASSKYTGTFLVVPVVAAFALGWRRRPPEAAAGAKRGFWLPVLAAGGIAALVFAATSPYVILDFHAFWRDLQTEREHMEMGHFGASTMATPEFYLLALGRRLLGWPLIILAAAGGIRYAAVQRRTWAAPLGIFLVVYLAIVSMWSMKVDRYLMPAVPAATILGVVLLRDLVARGLARARPAVVSAVFALTTVGLAVPTALTYPHLVGDRRSNPRTRALKWVESTIPSGAFILTEYYGPELLDVHRLWTLEGDLRERVSDGSRPVYAVQTLPMYQVGPERSAPFYDLRLYDMVDIFIVTASVSGRYLQDPARFPAQVAFYRRLEQDFQKLAAFRVKEDAKPAVTVYKRHRVTPPFGGRKEVPGPEPLVNTGPVIGEESIFYYSLGLNYEAFGFFPQGLTSYGMGLGYPMKPGLVVDLSLGAARCLIRLDRKADAINLLDKAAAMATRPPDKALLRAYRERLGPPAANAP
jgi:hypothetical protein